MIRELLGSVDLTIWPEAALVIFAGIFVTVCLRTFATGRAVSERAANIVLSDEPGSEVR